MVGFFFRILKAVISGLIPISGSENTWMFTGGIRIVSDRQFKMIVERFFFTFLPSIPRFWQTWNIRLYSNRNKRFVIHYHEAVSRYKCLAIIHVLWLGIRVSCDWGPRNPNNRSRFPKTVYMRRRLSTTRARAAFDCNYLKNGTSYRKRRAVTWAGETFHVSTYTLQTNL